MFHTSDLTRGPYSNMRAKLYKESFEFVRQQRMHCMMQGAWFMNALALSSNASRDTFRRPSRPWRFMRLVRFQTRRIAPSRLTWLLFAGSQPQVPPLRRQPSQIRDQEWLRGPHRAHRHLPHQRSRYRHFGALPSSWPRRPIRNHHEPGLAHNSLTAVFLLADGQRLVTGRSNCAGPIAVGRLGRRAEHAAARWRPCCVERDGDVRAVVDGNRLEDSIAQ